MHKAGVALKNHRREEATNADEGLPASSWASKKIPSQSLSLVSDSYARFLDEDAMSKDIFYALFRQL